MDKTFLDKVDILCECIAQNDLEKAEQIKFELTDCDSSYVSSEDLYTTFWLIMSFLQRNENSVCLDCGTEIAFYAMYILNYRKDVRSIMSLVSFAKDDLFLFYLSQKKLYYSCVNAFYISMLGKYPTLYKKGYKNIEKLLYNHYDSGFMEIDYAYLTYLSAKRGKELKEEAGESNDLEYSLILDLIDKYEQFTAFADLQYGFKYYNRPKANALFDACKKTPRGFSKESQNELFKRPIWIGLSYATAEACGSYYGRYSIAEAFGFADLCEPTAKEQSIIEAEKEAQKKRKLKLFIVGLLAIIGIILLRFKPIPVVLLVILAVIVFAESHVRCGKGSQLWYVGYHYSGPAYWIKNNT